MTLITLPAAETVLVNARTVAAICNCSPRHLHRLAGNGRMPPPVRIGALVRWRRTDVESWLAAGCPPTKGAGRG